MISERRYDIDWLRVISIGLLLIYHVVIGFQPWGVFIQFIQSEKPLESLWVAVSMINVWRIPFLFFVSGMGVYFALRKRNWKELIKERTIRILIPFLFGVLTVVPLHIYLWSTYYHQTFVYAFNPSHLWFLGNIFSYVLLGLPVLYWAFSRREMLEKVLSRLSDHPLKLLIIALPLLVEVLIIAPESYETYALTWHGYFLGMICFYTGFLIMISGKKFWETVKKWLWVYLALALGLYLTRVLAFDLVAPTYLLTQETTLWVLFVFGLGYKYLNRPSKSLIYLNEAAYPIYIIHMLWIYLSSFYFFPLDMNPWLQFAIVNLVTFGGSFATYHFIIRRILWLRPLFGLKVRSSKDRSFQLVK